MRLKVYIKLGGIYCWESLDSRENKAADVRAATGGDHHATALIAQRLIQSFFSLSLSFLKARKRERE